MRVAAGRATRRQSSVVPTARSACTGGPGQRNVQRPTRAANPRVPCRQHRPGILGGWQPTTVTSCPGSSGGSRSSRMTAARRTCANGPSSTVPCSPATSCTPPGPPAGSSARNSACRWPASRAPARRGPADRCPHLGRRDRRACLLLGPDGTAPARPRRQGLAAARGAVEHPGRLQPATADFHISSPLMNSYAVAHAPAT